MLAIRPLLPIMAVLFLLSACMGGGSGAFDKHATSREQQTQEVRSLRSVDWTEFQQLLHARYSEHAEHIKANGFGDELEEFVLRAHQASYGSFQLPEEISERNLNDKDKRLLTQVRQRIISAFDQRGRLLAPAAAAKAQVNFDCWMYKAEDPAQSKGIEDCRKNFVSAMEAMEKAIADANRPPPPEPTGMVTVISGAVSVAEEGQEAKLLESECDAVSLGVSGSVHNVGKTGDNCNTDESASQALASVPPEPAIYILYYDTDKVEPTDASGAQISEIAEVIKANIETRQHAEVIMEGHADRQGTDAYNMKLSKRRTEQVRKLLEDLGVAAPVWSVEWFGESVPAVDTADGVSEPLNRRVRVEVR